MARYRIKLLDGKIVGPFDADQVGVLFQKGHLSKTELAQVYPQGLWKIITSYQELKEIFVTIESVGTMTNPTAKEEKNKFPKSFDYNEPSLNLPQFNLEPLQKEKTKIDQILQEENITEKTKVLSPHAQTDYPDHTFIKEDPTQPPSLDTIQDAIAEDISQDVSQNISEDKTHMFQLDEMKESVEKNTKPTEIAWENFSNEAKKKNAEKK
ncbi:MAG: hypothetical protein KBD63_06850, partial [Bacteriovoracaceae bacterium]|nr:hypothetical protein [Bacteriovoracaceae bacterium]